MIIWHPDTEILLLVAAAGRIREKQPKQHEQERSDMLWLLLLYSSIRYTNHNTDKNGCRKTHVHTRLVEEEGNYETFLGTVRLEGLNCAPEVLGFRSGWGLVHPYSSLLCSLPVLLHSPVSMYKAQLCCQNIRAASAASVCKVSSWAIASSHASQCPMIFSCLWPFPSTELFFIALLRISGPSLVGQY